MALFLTPEGKEKLENELKNLIARRPGLARRIEVAKDLGDLSENAEYHDAKDEQGLVESRIRELEDMMRRATIVSKKTNDVIGMGTRITAFINGSKKTYEIVGVNEAKPMEGKISNESPLGEAFLGHKAGDSVEVQTPAGKVMYEIKTID